MALDDPIADPNSTLKLILFYLDTVITSIYAGEAMLKILAYGFISNRGAYLRDPWNMIDFTSLLISL